MAAKIKLQRMGTRGKPFYRVVVQDESSHPRGKVIEILGHYRPLKGLGLEVSQEKIEKWLKRGAQPTEKLRILLGKVGILPPVDLASLPKRKPKGEVKEVETEEKTTAETSSA